MSSREDAIRELQSQWADASVKQDGADSTRIVFPYRLNAEYDDIPLVEDFELEILIHKDYPNIVPKVFEVSHLIPLDYEHLYSDRSFCLGINGELLMQLHRDASLVAFIEGPVRSYLYSAVFHETYGRYPFGDRPHGSNGILDFYKERFDVEDELSAYQIMVFIAKGKYRGHLQCPCGSGIRTRNCHGDQLLSAINSFERETVILDLGLILKDLQVQEERRRKLQMP